MKVMMMKNAMNTSLFNAINGVIKTGIIFSLSLSVATKAFAQDVEELSEATIDQEIDQELKTLGQNPNLKTQTTTVKKTTTTKTTQSPTQATLTAAATPVVVSSSTAATTSAPAISPAAQSKKTVVVTKTINELPVKAPLQTTTVTTKTTTTIPAKKIVTSKTTPSKATAAAAPVKVAPGAIGGVQKLPVTFIEASPLSESRADEIRRKRQDEEMRTESKIVEKLEQSRMEDERRRAEALFGDRLEAKPAAPAVVIEQETAEEKAVAKEVEASAPLMLEETTTTSETNISEIQKAPGFFDSKYVGLTAGVPAYPDYSNIKGDYNVGIKFGMGHDRFLFELGLSMAQFKIEDAYYQYGPYSLNSSSTSLFGFANNGQNILRPADFEMKQYTGTLGSRYQILDGFVRPHVGGEFVYSYRQYSSLETTWTANSFGVASSLPTGTNYGDSHALDFGVLAGVDLALNDNFLIGADFKYLINVAYRINSENSTAGTPIEKLQHFVGGLSAVFKF